MDYFAYGVGNLIGPQRFIEEQAPKYVGAVIAMILCYCLSMILGIAYSGVCYWENKKRDREMAASGEAWVDEHSMDFLDLTDKENKSFRYLT